MLAPSFQAFVIVKDQYTKNGKLYVDVQNPKTKTIRSVRWYSDSEYARAYGKKSLPTDSKEPGDGVDAAWEFYHNPEGSPGLQKAMGFSDGPILVIRGNRSNDESYLRASVARYAVGIGWYIASTDELPSDVPANFKFLLLGFNEFATKGTKENCYCSKKPSEVADILDAKAKAKEWITFD